jgi:predicted Zn-dependent protease
VRVAGFLAEDKNLDGARKVLAEALAKHPNDAGLMAVLSQVALGQGKTDEAKTLLRKAIEKDPGHQTARLALAGQLLAENDPRGTLAVLPAEPRVSDPRVLAVRSQANLQLQDYEKARQDLEQLAAMQPKSAATQFQLATVYAALGEADRMRQHLDKAAELDPKNTNIGLAQARSLAAQGKTGEATAALGRLDVDGADPNVLGTKLLIAEKRGDLAEQLRLAEALFNAQPSTQTVMILSRRQAASGHAEASEQSLRAWIDKHPDDEQVALALSAIYGRTGRTDAAADLLRGLLVKHPEGAVLLNNLAWYLRDSSPDEALALARKAYGIAPDNEAVIDTYAMSLAAHGNFPEALQVIDRGLEKSGGSAYLRLQRVAILAQSGDKAKAMEELEALEAAGVPTVLQGKLQQTGQRLRSSR